MTGAEVPFRFDSDGLKIEGLLAERDAPITAVVLHPHPQYGGDMHNHVIVALCEVLASLGITTLRFNFRGTGGSEGSYDNGRGEAEDAKNAAIALSAAVPGRRVLLAGYSFGAMVAAPVAGDLAPAGLVLVSPPVSVTGLLALEASVPTLVVAGDRDPIAPPSALAKLESANRRVVSIAGADHSWWPGLDMLVREVYSFAETL